MKTNAFTALRILLVMTVLTGVIYPFFITGIAQLAFSEKANGSLVYKNGVTVGSSLLGQQFDSTAWFWSRPSVTGYSTLPSGASNLGPTSKELKQLIKERKQRFISGNDLTDSTVVPVEMLCASGSGLDPDISPEAAYLQINRIVTTRRYNAEEKQQLVELITKMSEGPQFSFLGENRINVLMLNLALDKIK
jgi:K+-transporting ATPase ATPase C chain